MRAYKIIMTLLLCMLYFFAVSQNNTVRIEGYVFEDNNRGLLKGVEVKILDQVTQKLVSKMTTGMEGAFAINVTKGRKYTVVTSHRKFIEKETPITTIGLKDAKTIYTKIELERKPGYIFDVTMSENKSNGTAILNSIDSARIEIYNNTTQREELVILEHPAPVFNFFFEKGNHYTMMVRKEGYFNKRMEAFVDVEGCILCFKGLGNVMPNVDDAITDNSNAGALLAEVVMDKIQLNKIIQVDNIYYDLDKWEIRKDAAVELNNVIQVLKNHPGIIMELGSHTDARGRDEYNLTLSEKRAEAAVKYIQEKGNIDASRIVAKGYGETNLVNGCKNGVTCSDRSHQKNRRTELRITGIQESSDVVFQSLRSIIMDEIANGNQVLTSK